jgi:hypothetical protein
MTSESLFNLVIILMAGPVAWGLWRASRPRSLFTVRVAEGKAIAAQGTVTPAFLERVREAAAAHGLSEAEIRGFAHGTFIRLHFSAEAPAAFQQQLRNWWATFGWSAPRVRRSRSCDRA